MATMNMAYDHPVYTQRHFTTGATSAGGGGNYIRFAAFTDMIAKSAQFTIVTAGTSTGNTIIINKVSGTTTTGLTTATLGTQVAGVTTNVTLGDVALAPGDQLVSRTGTDATGVAIVAYETVVKPGANVTA